MGRGAVSPPTTATRSAGGGTGPASPAPLIPVDSFAVDATSTGAMASVVTHVLVW
ncbi:MAG: hypothetical protein IPL61_08360 [Myxococcales bacterium]|nr:hypothetical protein [Myxococcales bacterium]